MVHKKWFMTNDSLSLTLTLTPNRNLSPDPNPNHSLWTICCEPYVKERLVDERLFCHENSVVIPWYHTEDRDTTQKTVQIHCVSYSSVMWHPANSSHHHLFHPLQSPDFWFLQICNLHRPGFSLICQHTLDTSPVYLSLYAWYDAPRAVRIGDNYLNLAQAHLFSNEKIIIIIIFFLIYEGPVVSARTYCRGQADH